MAFASVMFLKVLNCMYKICFTYQLAVLLLADHSITGGVSLRGLQEVPPLHRAGIEAKTSQIARTAQLPSTASRLPR